MRKLAAESTLTLEESRAILDHAGGESLNEVVLEMHSPKEGARRCDNPASLYSNS